jgi:hypothetical protein
MKTLIINNLNITQKTVLNILNILSWILPKHCSAYCEYCLLTITQNTLLSVLNIVSWILPKKPFAIFKSVCWIFSCLGEQECGQIRRGTILMQGKHDHRRVCGRLKVAFAVWAIEPASQKSSLARKVKLGTQNTQGSLERKKMVWVILANGFSEPQKKCQKGFLKYMHGLM